MGMNVAIVIFVMAVLLVANLPELPQELPAAAPLCMILPLAFYGLRFKRALPLCAFGLGFMFTMLNGEMNLRDRLPEHLIGNELVVTGNVIGLPSVRDGISQFRFEVDDIEDCHSCWQGRVAISWYRSEVEVRPGDRFRLKVKLSHPSASLNPGLFDYEAWLMTQGINGRGYVKNDEEYALLARRPWAQLHHSLRYWVRGEMERRLQQSPVKGLLIALTIGETAQISRADWGQLSQTGTNHLLIISGLHVGLIAAMAFRVFRLAFSSIRVVSLLTIIFTGAYASMAGLGLPVQRAFIMTSVVLLALCLKRKVTATAMFSLSLLGVVLFQPFAVLQTGFWLSFAAVFSLLYGFIGRVDRVPKNSSQGIGLKVVGLVMKGMKTQWIVSVAMFPILLHLVFQVSMVSFLVNIIAIPFISLSVIPLLMAFVITLPLSAVLASIFLSFGEQCLSLLWKGIQQIAAFDWVYHGSGLVTEIVLLSVAGVLILLSPGYIVPRWLGLLPLLPLFNGVNLSSDIELQLTFIDVGQGLSVLLQTENHDLLYDAGPRFGKRFDSGAQIVAPVLRRLGVHEIDTFIVSHGDNDHAGGMEAIQAKFKVKRLVSPFDDAQLQCDSMDHWAVDGVKFEMFSFNDEDMLGNETSCILLAYTEHWGILLTGDIEDKSEHLLQGRNLPNITIMSMPHHGSKSSSSIGLINHVQPEIAVVSSGFNNRFDHPHGIVLRRYKTRHIKILNTADYGAISFSLGKKGVQKIELARVMERRFWHRKI
jgi:competence protein ComEC